MTIIFADRLLHVLHALHGKAPPPLRALRGKNILAIRLSSNQAGLCRCMCETEDEEKTADIRDCGHDRRGRDGRVTTDRTQKQRNSASEKDRDDSV